ncbi:transcription factor/nuclear export subunit protein 2-domain-containing protein, partial [Ochromonadaceae sp. CCMP2298]
TDPASEPEAWKLLADLVKQLAASQMLDLSLLKSSLELNLLAAAGVINDEIGHQKRLVRTNTGLVFKQQKYNLLREETEGYAKLIVMLQAAPTWPLAGTVTGAGTGAEAETEAMQEFCSAVFSVLGHFDLDPNRVLDLVLGALEQHPLNLCLVQLLRRFPRTSIAHVLGFRFTFHHLPRVLTPHTQTGTVFSAGLVGESEAISARDAQHALVEGSDAPQSLYVLSANLVLGGLVRLEELLPYLRPSEERLQARLAEMQSKVEGQIKAHGVVSLNSLKGGAKAVVQVKTLLRSEDVTKPAAVVRRPMGGPAFTIPVPPAPPLLLPTHTGNGAGNGTGRNSPRGGRTGGGVAGGAMEVEEEGDDSGLTLFFDPALQPPLADAGEAQAQGQGQAQAQGQGQAQAQGQAQGQAQARGGKDLATPSAPEEAFAEGCEIVGLITALLSLRGWRHARQLLNLLERGGADPLTLMRYSSHLREAMAALVDWQLDALYSSSGTGGVGGRGSVFPTPALGLARPLGWTHLRAQKDARVSGSTSLREGAGVGAGGGFGQRPAAYFVQTFPSTAEEQLQQVCKLEDYPTYAGPLLSYLGYHLHAFPLLYTRLCRLTRAYLQISGHLESDTSAPTGPSSASAATEGAAASSAAAINTAAVAQLLEPALGIVCNVLLPALSASASASASSSAAQGPFLAGQVWGAIQQLPFAQRFVVYDRWHGGGLGKEAGACKHADVALAETEALHGARAELKRLAKENTKLVGRKLARFTQSCPLVVFQQVLGQVEAFDNLIPFVVDALKFSSDLARDCMAYSLVAQLKKGSAGDAKLKRGDTHFSQWFAALTRFVGTYYCRYPGTELKGLLHYLLQRLGVGDSLDLLVLKELLGIMGGAETLTEVSPAQLEGLSGGRALRAEVMGANAASTGGRGLITAANAKRAALLLREELVGSQTAIPLLLFIAQVRSRLLHDPATEQLKLISHLYDTAQDVLMQFAEFLVAGKSVESVAVLMPDLRSLLGEVGLAVPVCFQLVRPLLRAALQSGLSPAAAPPALARWHPLGDVGKLVGPQGAILPANPVWGLLSPRLYVLFWSLSLYDIRVPITRYEAEVRRLKDRYSDLDAKKTAGESNSGGGGGGGGGGRGGDGVPKPTAAELAKQKRMRDVEMRQLLQKVADLSEDQAKQKKHVETIKDLLRAEMDTFFPPGEGEEEAEGQGRAMAVAQGLCQHLIYPRMLMSPQDAVYCTQFLQLLHEMGVPRFSTLHCYDQLLRLCTPLVFCATEAEASFLGYALGDLLRTVNRWESQEHYEKEAQSSVGCSFPFQSPEMHRVREREKLLKEKEKGEKEGDAEAEGGGAMETETAETVAVVVGAGLSHASFLLVCKDWHSRLYRVLRASLHVPDGEYIYIRAGLILLARVSDHFPSRVREGDELLLLVQGLVDRETQRADLQIMAKSLLTILKKRAPLWLDDLPKGAKRKVALAVATKKAPMLDDSSGGAGEEIVRQGEQGRGQGRGQGQSQGQGRGQNQGQGMQVQGMQGQSQGQGQGQGRGQEQGMRQGQGRAQAQSQSQGQSQAQGQAQGQGQGRSPRSEQSLSSVVGSRRGEEVVIGAGFGGVAGDGS